MSVLIFKWQTVVINLHNCIKQLMCGDFSNNELAGILRDTKKAI